MFGTPLDFLRWILTPDGLAAVIAFFTSTFIPDMFGEAWNELVPPRFQRLAFFGLEAIFTGLVMAIMRLVFGVALTQDMIWSALVAVFIVYMGGSVVTGFRKKPPLAEWRAAKMASDDQQVIAMISGDVTPGRAMAAAGRPAPIVVSGNIKWDG